jgi:hypothetical protein
VRPLLLISLSLLTLLSGCAALPVAAWTAIGAAAGACAAACPPAISFERDAFDYFVEGEKDQQAPGR